MTPARLVFAVILLLVGVDAAWSQLPRSRSLIRRFARETGYPNGRPGYVVDHKIPLCAGGHDAMGNLQWQELLESRVKDRFELQLCRDLKAQGLRVREVAP